MTAKFQVPGDLDDADAVAERLVSGGDPAPAEAPKEEKAEAKPGLPPAPIPDVTPEAWAKLTPEEQWHKLLSYFKLTP